MSGTGYPSGRIYPCGYKYGSTFLPVCGCGQPDRYKVAGAGTGGHYPSGTYSFDRYRNKIYNYMVCLDKFSRHVFHIFSGFQYTIGPGKWKWATALAAWQSGQSPCLFGSNSEKKGGKHKRRLRLASPRLKPSTSPPHLGGFASPRHQPVVTSSLHLPERSPSPPANLSVSSHVSHSLPIGFPTSAAPTPVHGKGRKKPPRPNRRLLRILSVILLSLKQCKAFKLAR
jgi:hypothetical protein